LEHQEYLGDTIEKIAQDKAGIIKPNSRTLISDCNPNLKTFFLQKAKENGNDIFFLDERVEILKTEFENFQTRINFKNLIDNSEYQFSMPFLGEHQARNVLTGLIASQLLHQSEIADLAIVKKGIAKSNKNFQFQGRFQIFSEKPLIILDVAHNPAAFECLIHNLEKANISSKLTLVLALMADKDISGIAKLISGKFSKYIITKPHIERAAEPENIKQKLLEVNQNNKIEIIDNVSETTKKIIKENTPTLFAGSFYLIGEVLEKLYSQNILIK
jgi:dihydrofolate synthase/folylpolyglutamate synthase